MILLQTVSAQVLREELTTLYSDMLPLASTLTVVARGIAGLGALLYIFSRVWSQMARNEAIDVYPLLRPFAIGLVIAAFPAFVDLLNGILHPVTKATELTLDGQSELAQSLIRKREQLIALQPENYLYEYNEAFEKRLAELEIWEVMEKANLYFDRITYQIEKEFRGWMKHVLELAYSAMALILDVIRVFILIVLAIVGPLAFGMAVFDGFSGSLTNWISSYINVYLWLPITNIFSAIILRIQILMLKEDIASLQSDQWGEMSSRDWNYLLFMLIAIVGYCFIPKVASTVVQASGMGLMLSRYGSLGGAIAGKAYGTTVFATKDIGRRVGLDDRYQPNAQKLSQK